MIIYTIKAPDGSNHDTEHRDLMMAFKLANLPSLSAWFEIKLQYRMWGFIPLVFDIAIKDCQYLVGN